MCKNFVYSSHNVGNQNVSDFFKFKFILSFHHAVNAGDVIMLCFCIQDL